MSKTVDDLESEIEQMRAEKPAFPPVPESRATLYVVAILIASVACAMCILVIMWTRPEKDNASLIATVVGIFTPVVVALLAMVNHSAQESMKELTLRVDGRLTQVLALTAASKFAEGKLTGLMMPVPGAEEEAAASQKATEHDSRDHEDAERVDKKIEEARAEGVEQERARADRIEKGRT